MNNGTVAKWVSIASLGMLPLLAALLPNSFGLLGTLRESGLLQFRLPRLVIPKRFRRSQSMIETLNLLSKIWV